MTYYTVQPGQTFHLHGTLASDGRLYALGGATGPGGLVEVRSGAVSEGTMFLHEGSAAASTSSATLLITGQLTNGATGVIFASSGYSFDQTPGAAIVNDGVLINLGQISVGQGLDGDGAPATLIDNGTIHNSGLIQLSSYYVGYHGSVASSPGRGEINGVLTNDGRIDLAGPAYPGETATTLDIAGTLTNLAAGHLYTSDGGGSLINVAASGTLENKGALTLYAGFNTSTGSTLAVAGVLNNSGILVAQANLPRMDRGAQIALAGTTTNTGVIAIQAGLTQDSTHRYNDGATLVNTGALTNAGMIAIYGGTSAGGTAIAGGSGVLTNGGSLTNTALGVIMLYGSQQGQHRVQGATLQVTGALDNAGLVTVGAGATGAGANTGQGALLDNSGVVHNSGSIDIRGGANKGLGAAGLLNDSGRLVNQGQISIGAGGGADGSQGLHVLATGTLIDAGTISGNGVLVNDGGIGSGGAGVTTGVITAATLVNDASIATARHGAFTVDSAITAAAGFHGRLTLGEYATLTLGGPVAASQTVAFSGNDATLAIGDARDFAAILDLERPQATLDLLALQAISATASGTTFTIDLSSGGPLSYTLATPLASGTVIAVRQDGHGGTNIAFSAPASPFAEAARLSSGSGILMLHPS